MWAIHSDGGVYLESMSEICNYILSKMGSEGIVRKKAPVKLDATETYQIIRSKWTSHGLAYWEDIGVDQRMLDLYRTFQCEYLLNEKGFVVQNFQGTQTYAYVIHDKFKLYQPNQENFKKFFNQCPPDYMQGFAQVKENFGGTLYITKSMKDILVYQAHTIAWEDIIAPHGEGYNLSENWIWWMCNYSRVVIIYDFDLAGVRGAKRMREQIITSRFYKKTPVEIRFVSTKRRLKRGKMEVAFKDISDFRVLKGYDATRVKTEELFYGETSGK
jgi:hypothetical protein